MNWWKISQPVTEMIRRIDDEDRVKLSPISGDWLSWYVDFFDEDEYHYSRVILGWFGQDGTPVVDDQEWMTTTEKSALVKAVKRHVVKTDAARKLSKREEWCKLMGVNQ